MKCFFENMMSALLKTILSLLFIITAISCGQDGDNKDWEVKKLSENLVLTVDSNQVLYCQRGMDVKCKGADVVIFKDTLWNAKPKLDSLLKDNLDEKVGATIIPNKQAKKIITFSKEKEIGCLLDEKHNELKNVKNETFAVSDDKYDEVNHRPFVALGGDDYHPEFGVNPEDEIPFGVSHKEVVPQKIFVYNDTLVVYFGKTEGVDSVRILRDLSDNVIYTIKEFDKDVIIPNAAAGNYRLSVPYHVSILAHADEARKIALTDTKHEEGAWARWLVLCLLSILVVSLAVWLKRRKNKTSKAERQQKKVDNPQTNKGENPSNDQFAENEGQKLSQLENEISRLKDELTDKKNKIKELETYRKKKDKAEKEIAEARQKAKQDVERAEERQRKAEAERDEIKSKVEAEKQKEIDKIQKKYEDEKKKKEEVKNTLSETQQQLAERNSQLNEAKTTIEMKDKALERFTTRITDVAPLGDYAKEVRNLLLIGDEIEKASVELNDWMKQNDVADAGALVAKYITRYHKTLQDLNMYALVTDTNNVADVQFVYKGTTLANFSQETDFLEKGKGYFYETYLKKYTDALFVLNETMAGIHHLIVGLDESKCQKFADFREKLLRQAEALDLVVLYVKIFDVLTDNIDLHADMQDLPFDCEPGTICQINNCIVYRNGANKPNEKINVIVKD